MVERGTEGLLAVQRQVAAVQAGAQESLQQCSAELRLRLEELHRNHHRHQDLLQVCLPCSCPFPCCIDFAFRPWCNAPPRAAISLPSHTGAAVLCFTADHGSNWSTKWLVGCANEDFQNILCDVWMMVACLCLVSPMWAACFMWSAQGWMADPA